MNQVDQRPAVLLTGTDAVSGVDLSEALEKAGYLVVGPVDTVVEALRLLDQCRPTLAVIDVQLRDGHGTALVEELRRRAVRFLVHSDYRQDRQQIGYLEGVPWLIKPVIPSDVVAILAGLSLSVTAPDEGATGSEPASTVRQLHPTASTTNPFVRKLEGFMSVSEADRPMLERISAGARHVPAHTDLVHEGDKPKGVFLIMEGMAFRHKLRASGARHIMAYLLPGDLCDLDVALLDEMDHTITTFSDCKVVRLAPDTVAGLLEHHPAIARALRKSALVDEAVSREWLVNVGCRSALERVAHLFCELLIRFRVVGLCNENGFELPLTQLDLGDTTGLSTVHVNRTVQELRRLGLIELKGGRLTILNLPELKAIAEFKSNYLHLGERAAA